MSLPNAEPFSQTLQGFDHNRNYKAYNTGFNEGKITGSVGSAIIIGAMCQAGAIPLPIVGMFTVFAGCMGYLTGGFGGAHLSEMWHQQNLSGAAMSSMPGLLGGGILGILGGIVGTIIFMGPLILVMALDPPKNTENDPKTNENHFKFIINLPKDCLNSLENTAETNGAKTVDLPGDIIEGNSTDYD